MIRVLIADGHPLARAGFRRFLETQQDITHVQEVGSSEETLLQLDNGNWDLLVLAMNLPGGNSSDVLNDIHLRGRPIRVLLTGALPGTHCERYAVRAGAVGYVPKSSAPSEFIDAVRQALSGRKLPSSCMVTQAGATASLPPHAKLSPREFQILLKLASGITVTDAAAALEVTAKTISTYRMRILRKLSLSAGRSNSSLTVYAMRHGLIR